MPFIKILILSIVVGTWNGKWFPSGRAERRAPAEEEASAIKKAGRMLGSSIEKMVTSTNDVVVICLQEMYNSEVVSNLASHIEVEGSKMRVASVSRFYNPERRRYENQQVAVISNRDEIDGGWISYKTDIGDAVPRGSAFASFVVDANTVTVYSVHLKSNYGGNTKLKMAQNQSLRSAGIRRLLSHIDGGAGLGEACGKVVIAGDFNCDYSAAEFKDDTVFRDLENSGFTNLMKGADRERIVTFPDRYNKGGATLDYIFSRNMVSSGGPTSFAARGTSDHKPVFARLLPDDSEKPLGEFVNFGGEKIDYFVVNGKYPKLIAGEWERSVVSTNEFYQLEGFVVNVRTNTIGGISIEAEVPGEREYVRVQLWPQLGEVPCFSKGDIIAALGYISEYKGGRELNPISNKYIQCRGRREIITKEFPLHEVVDGFPEHEGEYVFIEAFMPFGVSVLKSKNNKEHLKFKMLSKGHDEGDVVVAEAVIFEGSWNSKTRSLLRSGLPVRCEAKVGKFHDTISLNVGSLTESKKNIVLEKKNFSGLNALKKGKSYLFEAATVFAVEKFKSRKNRTHLKFSLRDSENNVVSCVMWAGSFDEKLYELLLSGGKFSVVAKLDDNERFVKSLVVSAIEKSEENNE
jgi:endonuclease/exonuclease/phosphatase family metal-dependent hydrolase